MKPPRLHGLEKGKTRVVTVTSRMFRDGGDIGGAAHSRARAPARSSHPARRDDRVDPRSGCARRPHGPLLRRRRARRRAAPHPAREGVEPDRQAPPRGDPRADEARGVHVRRASPRRETRVHARERTRQLARGEGLHRREPRSRTSRALLPARRRRCARARATPLAEIHARVRVDRPGRPILTFPSRVLPRPRRQLGDARRPSRVRRPRASHPSGQRHPRGGPSRSFPVPRVGRRRRPRRRGHDRVRTRRAE
jgi:hypothetical protein